MKVGILGAGAFGTSLAKSLASFAKSSHSITLYCFEKEVANDINKNHINSLYLPDINLPNNVNATSLITDLYNSEAIILAIPVKFIRSILTPLKDYPKSIPLIISSKGIEYPSGALISTIITETLGNVPTYVLTGPSFASELANNLVSTLVLGGNSLDAAEDLIR